MRTSILIRGQPLEYCILHNVQPVGPSVGFYAGREIPETVVDDFGRRFEFVGIAARKTNGALDAEALGSGEFIVRPGLVYRLETAATSSWESMLHGLRRAWDSGLVRDRVQG